MESPALTTRTATGSEWPAVARPHRRARSARTRWAAIGAAHRRQPGRGTGLQLATASNAANSSFAPVTPNRIPDARTSLGLSEPFASAQPRHLRVTGTVPTPAGDRLLVPLEATAVVLNVTVVGPTADGFVAVRPSGTPGPPGESASPVLPLFLPAAMDSLNANGLSLGAFGLPTSSHNAVLGQYELTFDFPFNSGYVAMMTLGSTPICELRTTTSIRPQADLLTVRFRNTDDDSVRQCRFSFIVHRVVPEGVPQP